MPVSRRAILALCPKGVSPDCTDKMLALLTDKMPALLTGKMPVLLMGKMPMLLTGKMPVLLTDKMPVLRHAVRGPGVTGRGRRPCGGRCG